MDTINPIKQARTKKGLTQAQLADLLGVTKASVSGWEMDVAQPGLHRLAALNRALRPHLNLESYAKHVEQASAGQAA
jgi:transcriptional regulator with XRE-family HTH domain